MAEEKKVSVAKAPAATKSVAPAKETAVKKEAAVKKETAVKKEVAKKPATKKTAAKKPAAKKASVAVKKSEVVKIEVNDRSYTQDDLLKIARDVWQYDIGKKPADLISIELYVKPEEKKVYYVFNGDYAHSFDI